MKIGTISLNVNTHDLNYGAVLHSWAFQKYLEKYRRGETEVIDYTTPQFDGMDLKYPTMALLKRGQIKSAVVSLLRMRSHAKRYDKFQKFIEKNIRLSPQKYSQKSLERAKLGYDIIICESDVIWAPDFFGGDFDPVFFAAPDSMKNAKKIAYAPSMGNLEADSLTKEQQGNLQTLIKNFDAVSARESYLADYLQNLCRWEVPSVLDPVLLLNKKDYAPITEERLIREPYLLTYYPVDYNVQIIKRAKQYARENRLKVIELSRFPWDALKNKTITDAGVEEFLSLIQYADVIFSSSFHMVCFSIIFEREFFAFTRNSGMKIKDICYKMGLGSRFIENPNQPLPCEKIDYTQVKAIWEKEKKRSIDFLKSAMSE